MYLDKNHYCVIMAGGVGSRFWPLSTEQKPKQFLDILGTGEVLIQQTFNRFSKLFVKENIFVVTHKDYTDLVQTYLPELLNQNIVKEPERKNTAPCLLYAMLKIQKINPKASIIVSPSDHIISKEAEFLDSLKTIFLEELPRTKHAIVTIGIKPTRPDTGYGYIESETVHKGLNRVKSFREKPDLETAKQLISKPIFTWNSGMFLWKVDTIIKAFKTHCQDLYALFSKELPSINTEHEASIFEQIYKTVSSISVDYAIMEHSKDIYVKFADIGWSDLGTWGSVNKVLRKKNEDSVILTKGQIVIEDVSETFLYNSDQSKEIVVQGVKGLIIVNTNNRLLICKKEDEQLIKTLVKKL